MHGSVEQQVGSWQQQQNQQQPVLKSRRLTSSGELVLFKGTFNSI
jgi:hypothetical protein